MEWGKRVEVGGCGVGEGVGLDMMYLLKKRWQEYKEELYKKGLIETDNHNDLITHLESDILRCERGP